MTSISNRIKWFLVALISILLSWTAYSVFYNTDIEDEYLGFQQDFKSLEKEQNQFKNSLLKVINESTIEELWNNAELKKNGFKIHIYKNDSLVFWNGNQVNIQTYFSNIQEHFVGEYSNGFYLVDQFQVHDLQVYVSSLLKSEFVYENSALTNDLSKHFSTHNKVEIEWEKSEDNYPVVGLSGEPMFYLTMYTEKSLTSGKQLLIFCLYAFGIMSFFLALTKSVLPFAQKFKGLIFVYPFFLLLIRYFSIKYNWIVLFNDFELYDPVLYAHNSLIPNLGSLILSLIFLGIILWWLLYFANAINGDSKKGVFILLVSYLLLLVFSVFISYIFESLIINSSISLVIDEVFTLSLYSIIALTIIAALFLAYYLLIRQISIRLIRSQFPLNRLALVWFLSAVVFVFIEVVYIQKNIFNALWPVLLNAFFIYLASKDRRLNALKYHIAIVIVIAFYGAVILFENNESNEHQKRELFANQLISDQDPNMELEYISTVDQLVQSERFYHLIEETDLFSAPNLSSEIENCCFGEFWERYEMSFFFFKEDGTPLIDFISNQSKTIEEIEHLIDFHASPSPIAENLYYVNDYHDQLSYIGHRNLRLSDNSDLSFYILFKSKKIPEQIGFPRLLMNEKSYALQDLEDYSIARYSNDRLVMRFGAYNFPTKLSFFQKHLHQSMGFVNRDGISHYLYKQDNGQAVIISKPQKNALEKLSTFSYLFLFFGVFALIVLLIMHWESVFLFKSLQLSLKVQVVLISMVVGSFLIFAIVAIQNVTQQYSTYTNDNLKEKIYSVEIEIDQKIGDKEQLKRATHSDYLNYILKKFANVFVTDINFYDLDGSLFATSQPKLYDKGVSANLMNHDAFYAMHFNQRSEFIHREEIGELSFLSAYLPYTNHEGELLGYINLQHFSKQNAFENQMNDFIVAVINIAVLLLVITVVAAIFVSGWITAPLRLIQKSFKKVEFGKENKPIAYEGDDEIGALVKDYNNKLAELELKAMQLAKSERETAWREMAKQVAHEIKNPLTPMKLSVQHFQRSFDVNDPNSKEKIKRISASLIEQIDALTKIANEFSNFAKMPKANEESIDLIPILNNIKDLYSSDQVDIDLKTENDADKSIDYIIYADKNLIVRVFNNLVKNAIQATPDNEKSKIVITCRAEENDFVIEVKDHGIGMTEEIKKKMFSPNFTTKTTGSGLGLAMVKQIITNHNGEIWFETEENVGSTFFIRLPRN